MTSNAAADAFYRALADDNPEQLYDRAPCGYLSTTADGMIIKANQTFLTLTGYSRDDLVWHRTFAELLTPGGRIYHETHFAPMLRMQGTAREIALDLATAAGPRRPVLVNAVLERDPAGTPMVVRMAVFDATERREYERELLRAKKHAEESEARARRLAQTLQQSLLPQALPRIRGLDLAAAYRPAGNGEEVGGDFYDVFEVSMDEWVVAVGDVCGKGVEAAVVTALVRHTIRAAAVRQRRPSQVLRTVNKVLLRHPTDRFCTVALLRLRRRDGQWAATLSSGGHPLPVLTGSRSAPRSFGTFGTLLGVFDKPTLHDRNTRLGPGDTLLLYTDGVTEARRLNELYGEERLVESVTRHGPRATAVTNGILADVLEFQAGQPCDDIALVSIGVPSSHRESAHPLLTV